MAEMARHGELKLASLRSGMDPKTARKDLGAGKLLSETKRPRDWRTRADPFEEHWPEIGGRLEQEPGLQAKTLFEELQGAYPGRYQDGQLRTLQRHIRRWRAAEGPEKEVFFQPEHRPGEAMQTDFTWATRLKVTIGGEPFSHLLCHSVLPYSNWESVTVCGSESMPALKRGVQTALFRLGHLPENHQTDHSTAATHRDLGVSEGRAFNEESLDFCDHFGMAPRTIAVGKKEQNGAVEASHNALKNRLEQRLLLRGSRDFDSLESYEAWLWTECQRANRGRSARLETELSAMRKIEVQRVPEFTELKVRVTSASTIRVKRNTYSVPARLIGETVKVRIYENAIDVFYADQRQLRVERLRGEANHRINSRHVIGSLVRKPNAFERYRYRYRDDLFPALDFRRAYDRLRSDLDERTADLHYLRILHLAARTTEDGVQAALAACETADASPTIEKVKEILRVDAPEVPAMAEIHVDLGSFDELLTMGMEAVR